METKLLVIGDNHIGKGTNLGKNIPGQHVGSRVQDQLDILHWSLKQAVENDCYGIVLTGDVFDSPSPTPILINMFAEWCLDVVDHNMKLYIVAGNHDLYRTGDIYYSPLDIIEKLSNDIVVVKYNKTVVFPNEFGLTLMPFRDRKALNCKTTDEAVDLLRSQIKDSAALIPRDCAKFLVGHLAIKGSVYYDEVKDMTNELVLPVDAFSGYDQVMMGHIHKPQAMSNNVQYIGSMDISDFGECDQKKKVIVFGATTFKEIESPTRKLNKIEIMVPDGIDDPTKFVTAQIKKEKALGSSITKVDISYESPDANTVDRKKVEEFLLKSGVQHVAAILETKKKDIVKKDSLNLTTSISMDAAINKYFETKIDNEEKRNRCISLSFELVKEFEQVAEQKRH